MPKSYEISDEDLAKIDKWLKEEVFPSVIEKQKKANPRPHAIMKSCWEEGIPYGGVIGGGRTYHFTPTSIGTVFKVTYGNHELDLTDYAGW